MSRINAARAALAVLALPAALTVLAASGQEPEQASERMEKPPCWVTAVKPKPLSESVRRGLAWLAERQLQDGGWSQGDDAQGVRHNERDSATKANVGDTAAALLALLRSGSTPSGGPHAETVRRGVEFLLAKIDASDPTSLSVTDVNNTRLQLKLGPNIDTFLASMVLTEVTGHMPDRKSEGRLAGALDKTLYKIQVNQGADGRWSGRGWAPALANAMAVKGLNRAAQMGFAVDPQVMARIENKVSDEVFAGRTFAAGDAAGVALYAGADKLGTLQDSVNTNSQKRGTLEQTAAQGATEKERDAARRELARIAQVEAARDTAQQAVIERLDDDRFVAGFGSNGGEEFLSYMNIGESLVVKGDEVWTKWDAKMTANMKRIQNGDGSWTGHHCITGRTFCTASALLVLMTDRTPVPAEALENPS